MKHLTTLLTMAISFTGLAQQMPYNPDANGDDFVGVDDVLGVLGVYDTALMQPDLQCDYQGTELETFLGSAIDGSIVIDSIVVEYFFADSVVTFIPGCPDPVLLDVVLNRTVNIVGSLNHTVYAWGTRFWRQITYLNYTRVFELNWFTDSGVYQINYKDNEAADLTEFGDWSYGESSTIPFPDNYILDESGITQPFNDNSFAANCSSFRIIPFWHEAE